MLGGVGGSGFLEGRAEKKRKEKKRKGKKRKEKKLIWGGMGVKESSALMAPWFVRRAVSCEKGLSGRGSWSVLALKSW